VGNGVLMAEKGAASDFCVSVCVCPSKFFLKMPLQVFSNFQFWEWKTQIIQPNPSSLKLLKNLDKICFKICLKALKNSQDSEELPGLIWWQQEARELLRPALKTPQPCGFNDPKKELKLYQPTRWRDLPHPVSGDPKRPQNQVYPKTQPSITLYTQQTLSAVWVLSMSRGKGTCLLTLGCNIPSIW
jgi:hypothetical protein